ncbi:MAG: hypothetical protein ACLTKT_01875 [Clostridia bacterium]
MLSYIASNSTKDLIINVCERLQITILSQVDEVDFLQYIKETKVNFKLIKYMIIDLKSLKGTEENQINAICYFKELYPNIRIVILANGYDEQNIILNSLYEKGIYNMINANKIEKVRMELEKCLSDEGISKKEAKRFKKVEEVKTKKTNKLKEIITKIKPEKSIEKVNSKTKIETPINMSVYFFTLFIRAITKLLELIGGIIIFALTSLGLTILFNEPLRNAVFQILSLK